MGIKTVQDTSLTSVANAIRVKAEISGTLEFPDEFVSAIQNISTGITPSGTKTITQNGTYDVTDYASADVQTPQPSGSISITQNGTVDVSQYASANVNVSGGSDAMLRDLIEGDLTELVIPSGTTFVHQGICKDISTLESVVIPGSVTEIAFEAFRNCSSLRNVTIEDGVKTIRGYAFADCGALQNITYPATVELIAGATLYGDTSLASITCKATTPPTLTGYLISSTAKTPIYVPSQSVEAYKNASRWSNFAAYIQAIPE